MPHCMLQRPCPGALLCYGSSTASDGHVTAPSVFQSLPVYRVGHATLQLLQCNTDGDSYIPASSTSVSSQCRSQADTWVISSWAHYTFTPGPPLVVFSGSHRFQVIHACLSMPARSRSSLSLWSFPEWSFPMCCQVQSPTSLLFVIIVVTDSMNTIHYSRRLCFPVAASYLWNSLPHVITRHISSDSCHFPEFHVMTTSLT